MPRPAKIQPTATRTYGSAGRNAIRPTSATPTAIDQPPSVISRSRRMRNHGRACSQEPAVQPIDANGQYRPCLQQGNTSLLDQHQRHESFSAEECAGEQTSGLNDLTQATPEPQESGWHKRWQRHQEAGYAADHEADRKPIQTLTRKLQHRRSHGEEPSSPHRRRFDGVGITRPARAHHAQQTGNAMAPPKITSGITAKNTQCQLRCWVSHAETGGPTNDGSTQAVEI